MKPCPKCQQVKALDAFRVRPNGRPMSHCKVCDNARASAWAAKNKASAAEHSLAYRERNREVIAERQRASRTSDPTASRAATAKWRAANLDKARAARLVWHHANPVRSRAQEAKRRAMKVQAVACWADHSKIEMIYASAKELRECGIDVHVDHIYPLQGRQVCGLHTHDNLQILPAKANIAKGNKLIEV